MSVLTTSRVPADADHPEIVRLGLSAGVRVAARFDILEVVW